MLAVGALLPAGRLGARNQNVGSYLSMDVSCLYEANPRPDFVTEEMWEGSNNDPTLATWSEVGMNDGNPWGSTREMFWAQNLPVWGYSQNSVAPGSLNTTYALLIQYIGANQWAIDINGSNVKISWPAAPYSEAMNGGAEITDNADRAAAYFSGLGYYTTSGLAINKWYGVPQAFGLGGAISVSGPPQSTFANYYDGSGNCTAPPAPAQVAASVEAPATTPSRTIPATEASALHRLVDSMASNAGDSAPGNIRVVATTRAVATQLVDNVTVNSPTGSGPDENGAYLVEATGNFVAYGRAPSGQASPSGSAIWLVVDPNGNTILDWGISPAPLTPAAFATLGGVTSLS